MNIKTLNKQELIEYAKKFNIFKVYKFSEYIQERDLIIEQMNKLGITQEEVMPVRTISDEVTKIQRV